LGVAILLAAQQQQCLLKENENGLSNAKPFPNNQNKSTDLIV